MQLLYEIPDSFWSLFRSVNRETYIEALLKINEEYQYNNYFLSREVCIQVLSDLYAQKRFSLKQEEFETEFDMLETPAARVLNWLLRAQWLKKIDDFHTMSTNIVIPDYAAVFIEALERLTSEDPEETEVYIQNVYATLFSFKNDKKANLAMLRTALINTRKLNKVLQDMLHNMDKFFARLLEQHFYGDLLSEHLDGYVEAVVNKKYHILKTSDNFYIYKMDIKQCLRELREGEAYAEKGMKEEETDEMLDLLDQIERGFDDIEHRIANMDKEHTKYVRATVNRLNYLLSGEADMKGLVVQLLNHLGQGPKEELRLKQVAEKMNLSQLEVLSERSLYKKRRPRADFISRLEAEEVAEDLSREDVLRLNRIQTRYSREQIETFIEEHMTGELLDAGRIEISNDEEFEKLILAYDYSTRRNSKYKILEEEPEMLERNHYKYPRLTFVRRRL